jgi:hypothetical protein
MKRILFSVIVFTIVLFSCNLDSKTVTISDTGFIVENISTSFWLSANPPTGTMFVTISISYNEQLSTSDFSKIEISDEDNHKWTLDSNNFTCDETKKVLKANRLWSSSIGNKARIGNYKITVFLTNGASATSNCIVREPHTLNNPTTVIYAVDGVPGANEVAAIPRATIGTRTKTLTEVTVQFSINDSEVYNGWIWFFDSANNYLGYSGTFRDSAGDLRTSLIPVLNTSGTMNTVTINSSTISYGTISDISNIVKCIVVLCDGYQFTSHTEFDYISLGARVSIP